MGGSQSGLYHACPLGLIQSIDANVDAIDGKIDIVDANVDSIDGKIDSIDGKIDIVDANVDSILPETNKIDSAAVDGLLGVNNSLAYKVHELEKHFHNSEQWYGNAAGNFSRTALDYFRLTAGTSEAYGSEIQVHDGTVIESGSTTKKFDLHRLFIVALSANNATYKVQIYGGLTTFGESTLLTEILHRTATAAGDIAPLEIMAPRVTCNNKVWARVKSQTNGATIDMLFGLHTYAA